MIWYRPLVSCAFVFVFTPENLSTIPIIFAIVSGNSCQYAISRLSHNQALLLFKLDCKIFTISYRVHFLINSFFNSNTKKKRIAYWKWRFSWHEQRKNGIPISWRVVMVWWCKTKGIFTEQKTWTRKTS